MNVIVHYPEDKKDISVLQGHVSQIHARAVITYIKLLSCPDTQKERLAAAVIKHCQNKPE